MKAEIIDLPSGVTRTKLHELKYHHKQEGQFIVIKKYNSNLVMYVEFKGYGKHYITTPESYKKFWKSVEIGTVYEFVMYRTKSANGKKTGRIIDLAKADKLSQTTFYKPNERKKKEVSTMPVNRAAEPAKPVQAAIDFDPEPTFEIEEVRTIKVKVGVMDLSDAQILAMDPPEMFKVTMAFKKMALKK